MEIQWFTVAAQLVNLFILLVLLQRFLYKPVLDAMQRRQENVNSALSEAAAQAASAELEKERFEQAQATLASQRELLSQEMRNEIQDARQTEMEKLRTEVEKQGERWQDDMEQDKAQFLASLRVSVIGLTQDIAGKVLKDMADVELQDQLLNVFVQKLSALQDDEKRQVLSGKVTLETSFELDARRKQAITDKLVCAHKGITASAERKGQEQGFKLACSTNPALLCGVTLRSSTYSLSWDIASYLEQFDIQISDWFRQASLGAGNTSDVCVE